MNCLGPVDIRNPDDPSGKSYIAVPCGKCAACLSSRRTEWFVRLKEEWKVSLSGWFVTLTYNDDHVPVTDDGLLSLDKRDVQLFMKRFRKSISQKIKYFAVGEYGTNFGRPHYHLLIFHYDENEKIVKQKIQAAWSENYNAIGTVDLGSLSDRSINYVAKYVINNTENYAGVVRPFLLCSKGIGINYVSKCSGYHLDDLRRCYYVDVGGIRRRLPRYYRQKIYNEKQKKEIKKYHDDYRKAIEKSQTIHDESENYRLEMDRKLSFEKSVKNKIKRNSL